ncbi:MAG: RNA polymerase-associated protein RapA [Candidatus Methylumidiphilus sp.]
MPHFVPGQRWISETEPELGLGTVIAQEPNRVTVLFIASSERRTYAADNAPLTRVRFVKGDRVESVDGWTLLVRGVEERDGLLSYLGQDADGEPLRLDEVELNHYMQFNKPQDRLFTGQIDPQALFRLRCRTLAKVGELERSPVLGLCGARTSLIPHQLYIAHEVAGRHAPRVLLADEVGLGKTIEAGLVMHHQLLTGRAERILILVPEPLLHQWLVEMRRRFNLRFSLFDDERYFQQESGNPFLAEQLVLCGLDFFRGEPKRREQALAAGWDLCVVDEAHHLQWSEDAPSEDYAFVAALGQAVPGLLLLTATPEQLGKRSHFARLRLLDPDRFYSFEEFLAEERQYEPLAQLIETLADGAALDADSLARLRALLANERADELLKRLDDPEAAEAAREALTRLLLDRHGTGRILFRNTRATVQGFPERQLQAQPLPWPKDYTATADSLEQRLFPETAYRQSGASPAWWRFDPRVRWLVDTLNRLKPAKALVICAKAATAIELEEALRVLGGIGAAVFHEGLTIVARDRAAAWFADEEEGAQVLVCSEIGSEGRNFQFAHHLVLFDLPLNPDQLEQRIGRLDRIGQRETIQIHVPWLRHSAQAVLFDWYHAGLDAFNHTSPAGAAVFERLRGELEALLAQPDAGRQAELTAAAQQLNAEVLERLHQGRDRLLELNSCRKREAEDLAELIRQAERRDDLWPWLDEVFEAYGVTFEEHSADCHILLPGDHMRVPNFPELPEDGATVTLRRDIGLAREDMLFLTWEHPMVRGALDLILNNADGNAAFGLVRHEDLDAGQLLLEAVFLVECAAPKRLSAGRYLPQTLLRVLLDTDLQDISVLSCDDLAEVPRPIDREEAATLLRGQRKIIERMLKAAEKTAQKRLPDIIATATQHMLDHATGELKRLSALKKVNPYVRQEELDQVKANTLELHGHLQSARLRLDAIRVMLVA